MSLTVVEIAADVVAGCLAASKLLSAAQPLWSKLPKWLSVAIPVVVADLPLVASYFGVVTTSADLTMAVVTSVALLLPGLQAAEASA
jgi:hypothetical protein